MRRHLLLCATFAVSIAVPPSFGQSRPRIALIPLNPINVSRADAEVVSGLLETALVKTESYDVIEQREVSTVLEAQERSVSDCTDEKCAIAFGKLLAAEQIVLGTLSAIGGKYVLNAKIIDVARGKNIKADTVEVAELKEVTQAAELLAFKLAGLTYQSGQEVQIAQRLGEVFVETEPAGAVSNGYVYVIGGYGDASYLAEVLSAPVQTDGTLGSWVATTTLPSACAEHSTVISGGSLYVIGGCLESSYLSQALVADLVQ